MRMSYQEETKLLIISGDNTLSYRLKKITVWILVMSIWLMVAMEEYEVEDCITFLLNDVN